jgi:hypothetical protein
VAGSYGHGNEFSAPLWGGGVLDHLRDNVLGKRNSAPWS